MLSTELFTPGFPKDKSSPMFATSYTARCSAMLIIQTEGLTSVIHLDDDARFNCKELNIRYRIPGAYVPDVAFEVEQTTIYNPDSEGPKLGSLIRRDSELHLVAEYSDSSGFLDTSLIPVLENLLETDDGHDIGFTGWRLVVGKGNEKCELYRRDAS